ncbi:ABC transporter substrate-binding protein [Microbacterium sp.]|uniref:ABC transporter substrate-binding protein n=1 Tax=Microbacterium sp. TaxID=51671 RepID=UPI0039E59196
MPAITVATLGVVALTLTACSGGGGSPKDGDPNAQFEFWSFTGIGQKDAVNAYLEKKPDAKVKLSEVGSTTETATALTAALAGGKVPDLVLIQGDDLPKFVANPGNFIDLRTLGGDDLGEGYLDWAVDASTAEDGSFICLPTDVGGLGLAYRADLFEKAGLPTDPDEVAAAWSTWDDFIALGEKYTEATGEPFVDNVSTTIFFAAVNQVSQKYYSADGKTIYADNPEVKDAFQVGVDAYEAGISAHIDAWSTGWGPGKANGAFAVTTAPSWILSGLKNDAPDTAGKWRVTSLPGIGGNWGGSCLAIPARAKNPAGAWQYIQTMQSPEGQIEHFERSGTFPAADAALESDAVKGYTDEFFGDSPIGRVISDSVLNFRSFYNGPDTSAIGGAFLNALIAMEAGNTAPADAWQTGVDAADQAVAGG